MKLVRLPLLTALFALVPAGAMAAPGHWSSPVDIVPPVAALGAPAPQAFVSGGRSLAVAGDGVKPVLVTGDATGKFGAPVGLSPDQSNVQSVDSAVGPDGTIAVAWAAGGSAHVTVVPPGAAPSAPVDLPGTGVNSVAVAIAPDDGTIVVAFRVKESASSYGILESEAPRGGSFSAPATLDATSSGVDSVDVAAGAGGAVAVVYRKLAPRFKTYAVVRGALTKNFEAPAPLGVSATQADLQPRVAFDAAGTIVAAWANPEGAQYATRGALDGVWGAARPLNPAGGDNATAVDLEPTPQGGTAATWAGGGAIRAAVAGPGGGFGEPVNIDSYPGEIGTQPAVTVSPDQTLTVVANHPQDGAIQATDAGGGSATIGYGASQAATPVAVASSNDRTVAVWRNASGGYSAATRSTSAPASTGPGPKPAAPDRTAPKLSFAGTSRRIVVRTVPKTIKLRVRCDEACSVQALGDLRMTRGKKKIVSPLRPFRGTRFVAGVQTVTLRLGTLAQRDLRAAFMRGRGANVFVNMSAFDAAGNTSRLRVQLTIRQKARATRGR